MKKSNYRIVLFSGLTIGFLILHYVMDWKLVPLRKEWITPAKSITFSLILGGVILLLGELLQRLVEKHSTNEGDRYNMHRIIRLVELILIGIVAASLLFQNLYTVAVSFGLISLIAGFALQSPITSFIAWIYIVFRKPYQVGNRIQINGMRGDVLEINYLDTLILECSGDYLGNDRMSGRVIHFPNSIILKEQVINYSGQQGPFIWNETPIQIAYTSNLAFVEDCLIRAADKDFEERYPNSYSVKKWNAAVYFRVNQYAWLEAVVSYPVEPTDTTGRRNRILRKALPLLNASPEQVQFPEGTRR